MGGESSHESWRIFLDFFAGIMEDFFVDNSSESWSPFSSISD